MLSTSVLDVADAERMNLWEHGLRGTGVDLKFLILNGV